MFKQPLDRFFNALTFYSRIPGPNWVDYSDQQLNRASGFFPFIGYLVAVWCFAVYWLCIQWLPNDISIIISMVAGVLITGAFHEDGFADLCDGFGGGLDAQHILNIMKDSRLGTYGVCGLIFILSLKWQALVGIQSGYLFVALLIAHSLSRAWAISLIMVLPYVQIDEHSKAKPIAKQWFKQDMILAWCFALLPLLFLPWVYSLVLLFAGAAVFFLTRAWYLRKLNGYTGDALGASQQIQELLIYLLLLALIG
ncbi:adenosylcobinamide-GDP ribazoletransferase [Oceaniserpentilla sp. 4NH20-0058]|uniref:adenosylcobinamide-GDP ribazoletransferase n=1 Tax=Oceaniserpentilla sp. 4NH20-0058 TaxID=3127660 RepID=UPI00310BBFD7